MIGKHIAVFLAVGICFGLSPATTTASLLTYSFQGKVTFSQLKPYGLTIASSAPVSGQFTYDPSAVATHTLTNGIGYDQHIANGFHAMIGNVPVSADEYLIEIGNNVLQPDNTTKDEFIIAFANGLSPPLVSPLVVNGTGRTAGLLNLIFIGSNTLYSDTSLPSSFNFADFQTTSGLFGDKATGGNIVTFSVVPEPASALLLLVGIVTIGGIQAVRSHRRKRS